MKLVIVKGPARTIEQAERLEYVDWMPKGSVQTIADADVVITTDGHVIKDRYANTTVEVV